MTIEPKALRPPRLESTSRRVTFVNRSGRIAHIQFTGDEPDRQTIEVAVQIWAHFDAPGLHPYVVRLGEGKDAVHLRGVIVIPEAGDDPPDPPTCDSVGSRGVRVMGPCIVF